MHSVLTWTKWRICVSVNYNNIDSYNGLSHVSSHAIILTHIGVSLIVFELVTVDYEGKYL